MNTNFDTIWSQRPTAGLGMRCPLSAEQLDKMMSRAMTQDPTVGPLPEEVSASGKSRRLWVPAAAAAVIALLFAPAVLPTLRSPLSTPRSVSVGGQTVRFVCNHQCSADGVVSSLDEYINNSMA